MDYLYGRVLDANFYRDTILRKAFDKHLKKVAEALRLIELVDSCDSSKGSEDEAILAVLNPQEMTEALAEEANRLSSNLETVRLFLEKHKRGEA